MFRNNKDILDAIFGSWPRSDLILFQVLIWIRVRYNNERYKLMNKFNYDIGLIKS